MNLRVYSLSVGTTFVQSLLKIHLKSITFQPVLSPTNRSRSQTTDKRIIYYKNHVFQILRSLASIATTSKTVKHRYHVWRLTIIFVKRNNILRVEPDFTGVLFSCVSCFVFSNSNVLLRIRPACFYRCLPVRREFPSRYRWWSWDS